MLFFIFLSGHRRKKERVMKVSHFLYFLVLGGVITLSFLKLLIYEKVIEEKSGKIVSLERDLEAMRIELSDVKKTNVYLSDEYEVCLQDMEDIADDLLKACKEELSVKPKPHPYTIPEKAERFIKTVN